MSSSAIDRQVQQPYKYGWSTDIESELAPKGLNEDIIRFISEKKQEPEWMVEWRLSAYRHWLTMKEPRWANVTYPPVDYQAIHYYAAPKQQKQPGSLDEVDPKLLETFEKLGIPLVEQKRLTGVAVDAVFDSVSVATTFKEELKKYGVIFLPISEAIQEHPELVRKYMGSVVPTNDNFFAALNSAVFTDGSFVYVPKGVKCPLELSTYFRINALATGQFERTLIIADEGSSVRYLEGCSAPMRDENQLHAAVVELVAHENQAWSLRGQQLQDFLDAGGDRLGGHVEVPKLHFGRRQLDRRVLFGCGDQQPPAGRYRHEDDPHWKEHAQHDRVQRDLGRRQPEHISRAGQDHEGCEQCPQSLPV